MTNKPMLSVERELLERIARPQLKRRDETVRRRAIAELRALLDKPVPFPGYPPVPDDRKLPAAQHHGDPVAWVECSPAWLKAGGDCATAPRICVGREGISHLHPAHSSAEQPAPVAVVMPERCFHCNQPGGQCCTASGVAK